MRIAGAMHRIAKALAARIGSGIAYRPAIAGIAGRQLYDHDRRRRRWWRWRHNNNARLYDFGLDDCRCLAARRFAAETETVMATAMAMAVEVFQPRPRHPMDPVMAVAMAAVMAMAV